MSALAAAQSLMLETPGRLKLCARSERVGQVRCDGSYPSCKKRSDGPQRLAHSIQCTAWRGTTTAQHPTTAINLTVPLERSAQGRPRWCAGGSSGRGRCEGLSSSLRSWSGRKGGWGPGGQEQGRAGCAQAACGCALSGNEYGPGSGSGRWIANRVGIENQIGRSAMTARGRMRASAPGPGRPLAPWPAAAPRACGPPAGQAQYPQCHPRPTHPRVRCWRLDLGLDLDLDLDLGLSQGLVQSQSLCRDQARGKRPHHLFRAQVPPRALRRTSRMSRRPGWHGLRGQSKCRAYRAYACACVHRMTKRHQVTGGDASVRLN